MYVGNDKESAIEAFEQRRARDRRVRLADFLPETSSPSYAELLKELIRVDMEFSWSEGRPTPLPEYLKQYPQLQQDKKSLADIAYEEFRQRLQAGQKPTPAEYQQKYQISTSGWPGVEDEATAAHVTTHHELDVTPALIEEIKKEDPPSGYFLSTAARELPKPGGTFVDFVLERELGRGAFGRVYLARQLGLAKRPVALKITSRKQEEPQTLARLRHTNIMPIYSVHEAGTLQAICMPYLGQVTLADITAALRKREQPPTSAAWLADLLQYQGSALECRQQSYMEQILRLAEKMAAGLAHAHARGILHRDLKPANVLLSSDGEPLLLDFNLATTIQGHGSTAAVAGTLPYLAPEQIDQLVKGLGTPGSVQADVYALGLILYELLSGRFPYPILQAPSLFEFLVELARQRRQPPGYLREANPNVSPALAAIVHKCLKLDPRERYQNAAELHEDLKRQLERRVLKYAADRSWSERWQKWAWRNPTLLRNGLLVGLLVLAIAAGVAAYAGVEANRRQYYTTLFRDRTEDLRRAEHLAYSQTPVQLKEASELVSHVLEAARESGAASPGDLSRSAFLRYSSCNDPQELAELVGRAHLLQARLAAFQAKFATEAERPRLREAVLRANDQAQRWYEFLGQAEIPRWQRQLLESKDGSELAAVLQEPNETLTPRQLTALLLNLLDAERLTEATVISRRLVDQQPRWADGWFYYGLIKARAGNFPEALHGFDTAVALDPDNPVALHYRAKVRTNLGDFDGAIGDYSKALRGGLARVDILADRSLALAAKRDFVAAQADLDEGLRLMPENTRLYFLRASVKLQRGDAAGAQADRAKGMSSLPADAQGYIARALARRELRDFDGALADLRSAEKLAPNALAAYENQAQILGEELKRSSDAVAVLDRAVRAVPEAPLLYSSRAVYHARLGNREQSIQDVESALRLGPSPVPFTLYQVGCVYALNAKLTPSDANQALVYLSSALERGFGKEYLSIDPDLIPLRGNSAFEKLRVRFSAK